MKPTTIIALLLSFYTASHGSAAVTFGWAAVGNPGNLAEVQPGGTFGAVDYSYRFSKHEVTNRQYTEFLNAVDPLGLNDFDLYYPSMTTLP